ncbi:hypothetical protein AG1IA_03374 [Rhizoctonia solani AG-1 IA]|uniref:Uncharacterized protein n=1 Tax=Thanatephorus cucumeris (strain AG1-IA) TaxID=983506 RepID=L8X1U2_THACA|nr:hypothetical protein AG1IA_03374 [Rhizoctonia solani AG-1 IA]
MMCDVGTWRTLEGLVVACKGGWAKDGDPAARGLIGMLNLLEGLVLSRIAHSNIFSIRETTKGLIIPPSNSASTTTLNPNPNTGATPNPNAAGTPKNHPTPPSHVPSPAPTTSRSPVPPPAQQAHHPLPPFFLQNILKHSSGFLQSSSNIAHAYSLLNPAFMHTHYPRTHQICSTTSLGARSDGGHEAAFARLSDDGLEVDLDACARGEGLWAWPITCGAGMAHLIGFGRSMLWEFADTRGGYRTHHGFMVQGVKVIQSHVRRSCGLWAIYAEHAQSEISASSRESAFELIETKAIGSESIVCLSETELGRPLLSALLQPSLSRRSRWALNHFAPLILATIGPVEYKTPLQPFVSLLNH